MRRNRQIHRARQLLLFAAVALGTLATGASGQPSPQPSLRVQVEHLEGAALRADVQNEDRVFRQVRRLKADVERLRAARRFAEAVPLQQRVLEIVERERGRDRIWTLGEVGQLAELYQELGRHDEAEALYQRVLEAHERLDGPHNLWTLVTINSLGVTYQLQGRFGEAERMFRRAMEASEQANGPNNRLTLAFGSNFATSLILQGRHGEAEQYLGPALAAAERVAGAEPPEMLTAGTNLAVSLQEQGRLAEAEALFRRVLVGRERTQGRNAADTVTARANLATLQQIMAERGTSAVSPGGASASGPTCMVVTDIAIVDGLERRVPKRLCRTPPAMRWLRT